MAGSILVSPAVFSPFCLACVSAELINAKVKPACDNSHSACFGPADRWHCSLKQQGLIAVFSQSWACSYWCGNVQSIPHWNLLWVFMGPCVCLIFFICSHQATVPSTLASMCRSAEGPTDGTVTMDTDTGRGPEKGILGRRMDESHPHTVRDQLKHLVSKHKYTHLVSKHTYTNLESRVFI